MKDDFLQNPDQTLNLWLSELERAGTSKGNVELGRDIARDLIGSTYANIYASLSALQHGDADLNDLARALGDEFRIFLLLVGDKHKLSERAAAALKILQQLRHANDQKFGPLMGFLARIRMRALDDPDAVPEFSDSIAYQEIRANNDTAAASEFADLIKDQEVGANVGLEDGIIVAARRGDYGAREDLSLLRGLYDRLAGFTALAASTTGSLHNQYPEFSQAIRDYSAEIEKGLEDIDLTALFLSGMDVETQTAMVEAYAEKDPGQNEVVLSRQQAAALRNLLRAHAVFINRTDEGAELVIAEERYYRSAAEQRAHVETLRAQSREISARPDIVDADLAETIDDNLHPKPDDPNANRRIASGEKRIRNILILSGVLAAAVAAGGVVAAAIGYGVSGLFGTGAGLSAAAATTAVTGYGLKEVVKRSEPFQETIDPLVQWMDQASRGDPEKVRPIVVFFKSTRDWFSEGAANTAFEAWFQSVHAKTDRLEGPSGGPLNRADPKAPPRPSAEDIARDFVSWIPHIISTWGLYDYVISHEKMYERWREQTTLRSLENNPDATLSGIRGTLSGTDIVAQAGFLILVLGRGADLQFFNHHMTYNAHYVYLRAGHEDFDRARTLFHADLHRFLRDHVTLDNGDYLDLEEAIYDLDRLKQGGGEYLHFHLHGSMMTEFVSEDFTIDWTGFRFYIRRLPPKVSDLRTGFSDDQDGAIGASQQNDLFIDHFEDANPPFVKRPRRKPKDPE